MKKILIINGSLGGANGNTSVMINQCLVQLKKLNVQTETLHLQEIFSSHQEDYSTLLKNKFEKADGFIFTSGTYWDSWGSPMQKFLETITSLEASDVLLFKPCAVIITMHSVGGKEVLSRLQGVLNTMGLIIPPMSGMVYALSTHLALTTENDFAEDFWSKDDLKIVLHNLIASSMNEKTFKAWPVDKKDPTRLWNN